MKLFKVLKKLSLFYWSYDTPKAKTDLIGSLGHSKKSLQFEDEWRQAGGVRSLTAVVQKYHIFWDRLRWNSIDHKQ